MTQPERLTFGQIANLWSQEPRAYPFCHLLKEPLSRANHDEATKAVQQELVSAVWRGEFEQSGESVLTLPFPPGVQKQHGRWVTLAKIGQRPREWTKNPLEHPGEIEKEKYVEAPVYAPSVSPPHIEFTRDDLRQGLQQSNWCEPDIAKAGFDVLANLPIDFYPPEFRETCLEQLSIPKDDLRNWCKHHGLPVPAFSRGASAKGGGRKPGSGSYLELDKPLLAKMKRALDGGEATSLWSAASKVADQATGGGEPSAKAKRLSKRYREYENEIASWPEFNSN